jgi:hypothetical protein
MGSVLPSVPSIPFSLIVPGSGFLAVIGWIILSILKGREERTKRHGINTEAETKRIELANALTVQVLERAQNQVKSMSDDMTSLKADMAAQRVLHDAALSKAEERMTKMVEDIQKRLDSVSGNLDMAVTHIRRLMKAGSDADRETARVEAQAFLDSVKV